MRHTVMVYAVSSLIQIQPVWRQHSGGENPEALSLLHCMLLLWIFSIPLTCRSSTVWSSWQKWAALVLLCSSFLCRSNVHSSSHVGRSPSLRHTAGRTSCMIRDFFLHEMLLWMWHFLPVIWLWNVLLVTISWQHLCWFGES